MMEPVMVPRTPVSEFHPKWDIFLVVLLASSLSLNVFLGWKLKGFSTKGNTASVVPLTAGVKVASFEAYDISDRPETISCEGVVTIFYIFSPSCPWCDRNLENIKALVNLRRDSYRFIGLSLTDKNLRSYLDSSKLGFPVYTKLSKDTIKDLKLASTPQTILVSPEGRVIKNWVGAYGEKLRNEMEGFFGIKLPGLTSGEAGLSDTADKACP